MPWLTPSSVLRASSRELVAAEPVAAAGDEIRRKRGRFAGLAVDVNRGEHAHRRDLAALRIAHLVHELRRLVPHLEHTRAHRDHVAGEQLAAEGDVLLYSSHGAMR